MSTTNLFVELVVIGVGGGLWASLIVLSLFGWDWVPAEKLFSTEAVIPLLAVVYLLGIVVDRLADVSFDRLFGKRLRRKNFPDDSTYHHARTVILSQSEQLARLLEYGRSRLRICRGWTLNALLAAIALDLFIWTRLGETAPRSALSTFGTATFLLLAVACWFSWRKLTETEYIKTKEQSQFLIDQRREEADRTHRRPRRRGSQPGS